MPRITSEKAAEMIGNRFNLVLAASVRVRELRSGDKPMVDSKGGPVVTALKEIEAGLVGKDYIKRIK